MKDNILTSDAKGNLTLKLSVDDSQLREKLDILFQLKATFLKNVSDNIFLEALNFAFDSLIHDGDIGLSDFLITTWTSNANQLVCVLDFNITNFLREWLAAMRASNLDLSFHDDISCCRGN